ncbi:MAG TPA: hypothetical protein PK326_01760 [Burkholderiaceae bacterium]|nr:hypothetical protein [Burkholderiaceae bacterium]
MSSELQARLADGLDRVMELRRALAGDPQLAQHWLALKHWQSQRLARTYPDLLASERYHDAAQFFLEEIYGAKDFEQRDAETRRVVPKLARMLPESAVETLVAAVELDELSETLDSQMAGRLGLSITAESYARAFRQVGTRAQRDAQVAAVEGIGRTLDKLSRVPLLRATLHLMRGPAAAMGLAHLHGFLEGGFDAFAKMKGAREFLATIARRESALIARIYAAEADWLRPVD